MGWVERAEPSHAAEQTGVFNLKYCVRCDKTKGKAGFTLPILNYSRLRFFTSLSGASTDIISHSSIAGQVSHSRRAIIALYWSEFGSILRIPTCIEMNISYSSAGRWASSWPSFQQKWLRWLASANGIKKQEMRSGKTNKLVRLPYLVCTLVQQPNSQPNVKLHLFLLQLTRNFVLNNDIGKCWCKWAQYKAS